MEWIEYKQGQNTILNQSTLFRPFLGDVECGSGQTCFGIMEDYQEAYLSLDEYLLKNRESTYLLRACGDSMFPMIHPQDILVVDRSLKVQHGHMIALTYNGQRLCKRLYWREGQVRLLSDNPKYKAIVVENDSDLVVFGSIKGVVRLTA